MNSRILMILTVGLFALGWVLMISSAADAQTTDPVVLTPDSVTGEFRAKLSSATDDARLVRVCIFRIDANSPDPDAEFACLPASAGRDATPSEDPTGTAPGQIFEIPFTTVLVAGEDQIFTARNIAEDPDAGVLVSANSVNSGRIPARLGPPLFVVEAP